MLGQSVLQHVHFVRARCRGPSAPYEAEEPTIRFTAELDRAVESFEDRVCSVLDVTPSRLAKRLMVRLRSFHDNLSLSPSTCLSSGDKADLSVLEGTQPEMMG